MLLDLVAATLPDERIFAGLDAQAVNQRIVKPAARAAGLDDVHTHALRHHAASLWVSRGLPLFEVARALGHSSTRMVESTYGHLVPDAHDRLLEAMG